MTYENLLQEAHDNNIYVIENADFISMADGLINGDVIGINRNIRSSRKRNSILAEELGHFHTTVGSIIDQSSSANRKQEHQARAWAYNHLIGITGIIDCYKNGCQNIYEMAEHLNVTDEFFVEAIEYYHSRYGLCVKVDNYVIYFGPSVGILELI